VKKSIVLLAVIFVSFLFFSSCKSEDFVWNPVGIWNFTVTGIWGETWLELLTFGGSDAGGTVSGWSHLNTYHTAGTWTRTGFLMTVTFDYLYASSNLEVVTLTCRSSEVNPNTLTGTGTWLEYIGGSLSEAWTLTQMAQKETNLQ
jgi:hypothetical protein